MEKLNFKSIHDRLKSDTPKFWKGIRKIMAGCATIGAGLVALPPERISFLPANLPGILMSIGVVGVALASMTHEEKTNQ